MESRAPRLVCLGNLTVDDVYLPDGSFMPECMGGDALYAALGARLWESNVQLLAPLSPDLPQRTLEAMIATKFDLESLPTRDAPTIRNRVYYHADGSRRWEFLADNKNFHSLSPLPEDIPEHYIPAEGFLISAMSLKAQELLVPWLRTNTKAVVALDTQEDYVSGNEHRLEKMFTQVHILMPSAAEVESLFGHRDWLSAAGDLGSLGPQIVVIKLGENGVLVYESKSSSWFEQPAQIEKVVDTTGAGDAFCGGFMAAYLQNPDDLHRAARAGSISASFAVASFGMQALLDAKPEDVESLL